MRSKLVYREVRTNTWANAFSRKDSPIWVDGRRRAMTWPPRIPRWKNTELIFQVICVIAALGSGHAERTHVAKIQTGGVQVDQRIDRIIRSLNGDIVLMPHARQRLSFDRACLTREMFGGPRPVRQRCFPSGQGLVATAGFDSQLSFGSVWNHEMLCALKWPAWFVVVLHVITCRGDIKYRHTRHSIMSIRYTASVEGPKTPQVKLRIAEPWWSVAQQAEAIFGQKASFFWVFCPGQQRSRWPMVLVASVVGHWHPIANRKWQPAMPTGMSKNRGQTSNAIQFNVGFGVVCSECIVK